METAIRAGHPDCRGRRYASMKGGLCGDRDRVLSISRLSCEDTLPLRTLAVWSKVTAAFVLCQTLTLAR